MKREQISSHTWRVGPVLITHHVGTTLEQPDVLIDIDDKPYEIYVITPQGRAIKEDYSTLEAATRQAEKVTHGWFRDLRNTGDGRDRVTNQWGKNPTWPGNVFEGVCTECGEWMRIDLTEGSAGLSRPYEHEVYEAVLYCPHEDCWAQHRIDVRVTSITLLQPVDVDHLPKSPRWSCTHPRMSFERNGKQEKPQAWENIPAYRNYCDYCHRPKTGWPEEQEQHGLQGDVRSGEGV